MSFTVYTDPYIDGDRHADVAAAVINVEIAGTIKDITNPETSAPLCTDAKFTRLWEGAYQGTVTVEGEDSSSAKIKVSGGPCYIDFVFDAVYNGARKDRQAEWRDWRPIGIAFKTADGASRGDINMPMKEIRIFPAGLQRGGSNGPIRYGSTLRVLDTRDSKGVVWSYWLLVQDKQGRIAMIDPEIENEQN